MKKIAQALSSYREAIPDVANRFLFDNHAVIDANGLIITPQGFAKPFFHKPTNSVGLFFSKTANNLAGTYKADGQNYISKDEAKYCYIISARRCRGDEDTPLIDRDDKHTNEAALRQDLDNFCDELGERNLKHFTGFMAGDVFTNGRLSYAIVKRNPDRYDVVLRLPTRRKDGSFVPFDPTGPKNLRSHFAKVSVTVAKTQTYEEARLALMKHWQIVSSELWDEKNIFKEKGALLQVKKFAADVVNQSFDHAFTFSATTIAIAGATMLINPALGVFGAFMGTVVHAVAHISSDKFFEDRLESRYKSREAKNKIDIEAYGYNEDVSDHFKFQGEENISKLCPHLDMERFCAEDFELLDITKMSLLRDREQLQSNFQGASLSGHLLFMHQRGFSSICTMLDKRTELRMFQSGVVRFMHEKKNGNVVIYGQYRPELCLNDKVRLPEPYIRQFNGGIMRVEYDRSRPSFSQGLVGAPKNVDYKDMVKEIEKDCLFSTQSVIPWDIVSKSQRAIYHGFTDVKSGNNIHKNPPLLPDVSAVLFKDTPFKPKA